MKKFKCSNAAQECNAPQQHGGSAENRIFWQNDNFEMYCISRLICSRQKIGRKAANHQYVNERKNYDDCKRNP